jgi:Glycosyltransferase family 28 C-terminal domain
MILIESGGATAADFEAKVLFAQTLEAAGHPTVIDAATLPPDADAFMKYEAAPFLAALDAVVPTSLIVIGAEGLDGLRASKLRASPQMVGTVAGIGWFPNRQSMLSAQARLAHATGREPVMADLSALSGHPVTRTGPLPPFVAAAEGPRPQRPVPHVLLHVSRDLADDPMTLPVLSALARRRDLTLAVVLESATTLPVSAFHTAGVPAYRARELSPVALAAAADIFVFSGAETADQRAAMLMLQMLWAGCPVIDMTVGALIAATGAPVLRGPVHLMALAEYLSGTVLPSRGAIADRVTVSPWRAATALHRLEAALGLTCRTDVRPGADKAARRAVFMPTNGVGLGHAVRSSLVASAMGHRDQCGFAAFPSCVDLLTGQGFRVTPLVARTTDHADRSANDLMTYLRLRQVVRRDDVLVFDGGYVFDSVLRVIGEKSLRATWVRRGLWQPGQVTPHALEREKAFRQVIVPGEAFAELNRPLSYGPKISDVGPVVRRLAPTDPSARSALRECLAAATGIPFDTLVVSMLGAGVAADRSAQLHLLCQIAERRPRTLHLIVVWPGAVIAASLLGRKATRVVRTLHALELAASADLVVSAAGYNAFHECIYNAVPAIFISQMAEFMDDQDARAKAADDRGLAVSVQAHELLLLEREVGAMLDGGKADTIRQRLSEVPLPGTGNADAAALIDAEVAG